MLESGGFNLPEIPLFIRKSASTSLVHRMKPFSLILICAFLQSECHAAPAFKKRVLVDRYFCDGINHGDFNRDGKRDIVAGPFWYEGPSFKKRHAFYPPVALPPAASPSNSMFSYVWDFDGDGQTDAKPG